MKALDEDELVRLWHTNDRMNEIATNLGIEPKQLANAWRMLKRRGKLPLGDRPRHERHVTGNTGLDGRPNIGHDDALLDALRKGKR
jgi:hypothetical protein